MIDSSQFIRCNWRGPSLPWGFKSFLVSEDYHSIIRPHPDWYQCSWGRWSSYAFCPSFPGRREEVEFRGFSWPAVRTLRLWGENQAETPEREAEAGAERTGVEIFQQSRQVSKLQVGWNFRAGENQQVRLEFPRQKSVSISSQNTRLWLHQQRFLLLFNFQSIQALENELLHPQQIQICHNR